MLLILHLFLLTSLFSLIVFELFPLGNNKICISIIALGLASLFCTLLEWFRVVWSFRSVYFLLLECNP
jgi:hypothetical protein